MDASTVNASRPSNAAPAFKPQSETVEFHHYRALDIFQELRKKFDPMQAAHHMNRNYHPANLLKREALRFDPDIRHTLGVLWKATDVDRSGV